NAASFRRGARALGRLGLATYVHGDLALGPLARAAARPGPIRNVLVKSMPSAAWSGFTVDALDREEEAAGPLRSGARGLEARERVDALILTVLPEEHEAALAAAGIAGARGELAFAEIGALRVAVARLPELGG